MLRIWERLLMLTAGGVRRLPDEGSPFILYPLAIPSLASRRLKAAFLGNTQFYHCVLGDLGRDADVTRSQQRARLYQLAPVGIDHGIGLQ